MKFETTILTSGKTATGIEVPAEIVEALGGGKRPSVTVTLNGYTYRSTVAPMGGKLLVPVSAEVRKNAGVAGGDLVEVGLELDTEPREVTLPDDFAAALAAEPAARQFFDSLSYSNRRWHVMQVEGAKTEATRQRRIEKSVTLLAASKIR
jgi:hypothetical protein